jgi:uncharacterized protein (DUF302 family)
MSAHGQPEGLNIVESQFGPTETTERLLSAIAAHGMTVMARIDHAAAAAEVGMTLRPTEVVIFGNPRGGTPLMQAVQTAGIDLPLKALVWEDEAGKTWLAYNDPTWIAARHGLEANEPAVRMAAALAGVAHEATGASA